MNPGPASSRNADPNHALPPRNASPAPTLIGGRLFEWGSRTFVMGIVNVTPDSFSGDGLLSGASDTADTVAVAAAGRPANDASDTVAVAEAAVQAAVDQARRMVAEGADIVDVGGESTRPGHAAVSENEEASRVIPAIAAIRAALPDMPISVDTSKPAVAAAALDAGASLLNDVWGVSPDDAMARVAAARHVPLVLMHNRTEPRYVDLMAELLGDLAAAVERAVRAGMPAGSLIVDPGFGFGKTAEQNLLVLRELARMRELGLPILLGTSRKSTIGRVLGDLPPNDRLEGTLATTALGIAAGVDMVRVHDVRANVRVARMCDAVLRQRTEGAS
jgi:dihydropteroate synthase